MNDKLGTIFPVKKNDRYKLLELSDSYWLIDADRNIFSFFLAVFAWLLPQKAYPISQDEFKNLRYIPTQSDRRLTNFLRYILLPIGVIFARFFVKDFNLRKIGLAIEMKIFLLIITFVIGILFRVYLSKCVYKKRILNISKIKLSNEITIKIHPESASNHLNKGLFC